MGAYVMVGASSPPHALPQLSPTVQLDLSRACPLPNQPENKSVTQCSPPLHPPLGTPLFGAAHLSLWQGASKGHC